MHRCSSSFKRSGAICSILSLLGVGELAYVADAGGGLLRQPRDAWLSDVCAMLSSQHDYLLPIDGLYAMAVLLGVA